MFTEHVLRSEHFLCHSGPSAEHLGVSHALLVLVVSESHAVRVPCFLDGL
jgi:hypothetical protein